MIGRLIAAAASLGAVLLSGAPAAATPGPATAPQYWFDDWNIPAVWADGTRGQGIVIAEIDTGVNADLPELRGRIVKGTDLGRPGDGRIDREVDAFGHGTAMASVMVARPGLLGITGLAPAARVLPVAVPLDGTTDAGGPDQLPRAIRYAADHGAKIISMSLGERRSPATDAVPCPAAEQSAIFHALRKGVVVVAAVGNTGQMHDTVVDPGVCLGVVSVGAVDASGAVARFSGRAPYLTLTAPGVDIASLSRVEGRAYAGAGTSQATALTAAGIALVWSRYPELRGDQVVGRVLATLAGHRATPSSSYGYGRLDVHRAVTAKLPARLANPVYAAAAPFLVRTAAAPALGAAPPPAAGAARSTGDYAVDAPPKAWLPSVVVGAAVALAGLLLLIGLVLSSVAARRNRRGRTAQLATAQPWAAPAPPPYPDGYEPLEPPAVYLPVSSSLAGEPVHPADDGVQRGADDRF